MQGMQANLVDASCLLLDVNHGHYGAGTVASSYSRGSRCRREESVRIGAAAHRCVVGRRSRPRQARGWFIAEEAGQCEAATANATSETRHATRARAATVPCGSAAGCEQRDERPSRRVGCPACAGTGYRGRLALHEVMVMTDDLRRLLVERVPSRRSPRSPTPRACSASATTASRRPLPAAPPSRRSPASSSDSDQAARS